MAELRDKDLQQVDGGTVVMHNLPKIDPKDKYVMNVDESDLTKVTNGTYDGNNKTVDLNF